MAKWNLLPLLSPINTPPPPFTPSHLTHSHTHTIQQAYNSYCSSCRHCWERGRWQGSPWWQWGGAMGGAAVEGWCHWGGGGRSSWWCWGGSGSWRRSCRPPAAAAAVVAAAGRRRRRAAPPRRRVHLRPGGQGRRPPQALRHLRRLIRLMHMHHGQPCRRRHRRSACMPVSPAMHCTCSLCRKENEGREEQLATSISLIYPFLSASLALSHLLSPPTTSSVVAYHVPPVIQYVIIG